MSDRSEDCCPAISSDETIIIDQLRENVYGIDHYPDGRLLRWLRACSGNAKLAESALSKHLIFRKAWQLDENFDGWNMPQVLHKYLGYGFCEPDRHGSPVLVCPFGSQDVQGIFKSCQSQDYIKFCLMVIERGMQQCEQLADDTEKPYAQMTVIFDLEHITVEHFNCKPFAATFLTLIALYQEHYPLLVKSILLVNAPSMAQYTCQVLMPFFTEHTKQLVQIPEGDQWLHQLYDLQPDRHLEMPHDDVTVPDTYFLDWSSQHDKFQETVTVYPGSKHLIEIEVDEPGTMLNWGYATLNEDIGFAVYYDGRGGGDDKDLTAVWPSIRLECSLVPVTGSICCEQPGRYVLEFDNSYSWFSAKDLKYSVNLEEP